MAAPGGPALVCSHPASPTLTPHARRVPVVISVHPSVVALDDGAEPDVERYDVVLDVIDELLDLTLNYRQSGHPGGSRSKAHLLLATLLSGAMRWDVLRPWRPFSDRFVLSAGHTVPLVYATLAAFNEAMRARHAVDGDDRFAFPDGGRWALTWEDLLGFRHRGGLPGHAEMAGKTLLFKANTGPSGHGMPIAAGQALALKMAGCPERQGLRHRGRRGPDAGRHPRDPELGLGPRARQPRVPRRLERLRHRSAPDLLGRLRLARGLVRLARLAHPRHARGHGLGPRDPDDPRGRTRRQPGRSCRRRRGSGRRRAAATARPTPRRTASRTASTRRSSGRSGAPSWRVTASRYEGVDEPAPAGREAIEAQARANLQVALSVLTPRPRARRLARRPAGRDRGVGARPDPGARPGARQRGAVRRPGDHRLRGLSAGAVPGARVDAAEPCRARDLGRVGQRLRASARTDARSSSGALPTSPSPPTSRASARTSGTCPAGAGTSGTGIPGAPSCRRRSRRWPTPASWPAWPR